MTPYCPMTTLPTAAAYTGGDVLVLIGELFGRGYANGLIEEASRLGMTVIGTTVGRRDSDNTLRPLTAEELSEAEQILGASIINIPLEASRERTIPSRVGTLPLMGAGHITTPAEPLRSPRTRHCMRSGRRIISTGQ
jgi:hypothetical protein